MIRWDRLFIEDRLIKEYWPMYNVKQKQFLKYKYLNLTDDLYPRFKIVDKKEIQASVNSNKMNIRHR